MEFSKNKEEFQNGNQNMPSSIKQSFEENGQYEFEIDDNEEEKIKAQFLNISEGKQTMDYAQFRLSLGLLGREDSFINRIFQSIDHKKLGTISEEDYLKYILTILHGSQLEHQQLGWKIISKGKNELQIKDLMQLFEQISIVWNALTDEIVQPKKKYVEELFSILDVDQDQVITFEDYRVFYKSQPFIFGWFQYFNNMDLNDTITKIQMEKTRTMMKVRNSTEQKPYKKNPQELQKLMDSQQSAIDSKMVQLIKQIQNVVHVGNSLITNPQPITQLQISPEDCSKQSTLATLSYFGKFFKSKKLNIGQNTQQLNRIRRRKQKLQIQQNRNVNIEMIRQLEKVIGKCYKVMSVCSQFREMKQLSKKFSPKGIKIQQFQIHEDQKKGSKKNILVYFGHKNWNLVLNLMVGLRKSIRSLYELNSFLQLKSNHFRQEHEFLLGNKVLNGKCKQVYKFIQIAPVIFQKLRTNYGITNIQYQRSVGPQSLLNSLLMGNLTGLNQKCSTGKSGSFFYLTLDNKIYLKTIPKHQFLYFMEIVQHYYKHMKQFTNTLIVRIYGLYKLKIFENKQKVNTIYFISMENIEKQLTNDFNKNVIHKEVYDLKGSRYDRSGQEGKQLKDNDWIERKMKIHVFPELKKIFKNQIEIDSRFFKNNNINDYSLMVSIVQLDKEVWMKQKQNSFSNKSNNIFKSYKGGILGLNPGEFYILSIIDILTAFQIKKKFQYAIKSTFLSKDVSCIPPNQYCERFRNFMYQLMDEDDEGLILEKDS